MKQHIHKSGLLTTLEQLEIALKLEGELVKLTDLHEDWERIEVTKALIEAFESLLDDGFIDYSEYIQYLRDHIKEIKELLI